MSLPTSLRLDAIRDLLPSISSIITWKTLALLLAVINLKSLPLAWHIRIIHHLYWNLRRKPQENPFPKGKRMLTHTDKPTHPVFVPNSITSRTPILETDYNFHKSNSTYFSDLDISRTALVTRVYTPGITIVSKELDAEILENSRKNGTGKTPKPRTMYIALGSVYCGFKREIKPFEKYEIQSKVVAWDRKWLYVLSFFLRPGTERTLFASAVSKYVVKKGRLTVPPERVLRASGFLPERSAREGDGDLGEDGSGVETPEGITASSGVDGSLVREVLKIGVGEVPGQEELEREKKVNVESWVQGDWTWEMIEEERLRGLKVVEGYVNMDAALHEEWER